MTERIIVENQRGGGCASILGALIILGLAINYWYVALPLAALGVVAYAVAAAR